MLWDKVESHILVVFDQLVEAEQDAQPAADLVRLQVEDDLLHDVGPLVGVVLLDHVMDARRQLDPAVNKRWGRLGLAEKCVFGGGLRSVLGNDGGRCGYLMRSGEWMMASTMFSRMIMRSCSGMVLTCFSVPDLSEQLQC